MNARWSEFFELAVGRFSLLVSFLLLLSRSVPVAAQTVRVENFASQLNTPWSLKFTPQGKLIYSSRNTGHLYRLSIPSGDGSASKPEDLGALPDVRVENEAGALGIELDPDYQTNGVLYACASYSDHGKKLNRVFRVKTNEGRIIGTDVLIDGLVGGLIHNGCRVGISPDKLLYVTIGEGGRPELAQNLSVLGGKILRLHLDGSIPKDNPFPDSPVYSLGHRNPQGLTFHPETHAIWSTEHGPDTQDELNLIEAGANYGWPLCRGIDPCPQVKNYRPAIAQYGPTNTIAISNLVFYQGSAWPSWRGDLFFVSLKAGRLYRLRMKGTTKQSEQILINGEYGRLRDIAVGPDGFFYISTDNGKDSKILRVRP